MALGVLAVAAVCGLPASPLTPALPAGAQALWPFRMVGRLLGMRHLSPRGRFGAAVVSLGVVDAGFLLAARSSWKGLLTRRTAVVCAIAFHIAAVAMPLYMSHDVYQYAMSGRIVAVHHANPYVSAPVLFRSDPLFPFVSADWRHTTAVYGPAFVQLTALFARMIRSPAGLIWAFKGLSGAASIAAMFGAMALARRQWPERAAFAAVLVGWNPVVVFNLVGGGHADALIGLAVVLAAGCGVARWRHRASPGRWRWELGATAVLSVGVMVKAAAAVPLALSVVASMWSRAKGNWTRMLLAHVVVVAVVWAAFALPFVQGHDPTLGLAPVSHLSNFLAPSAFLVVLFQALGVAAGAPGVGGILGSVGQALVAGSFVAAMVLLIRRQIHQAGRSTPLDQTTEWAWAMLLLVLSAPMLWPWYLIWFLPLAWALPRIPRNAVLFMSASLPLFQTVAEATRLPDVSRLVIESGKLVLAPALLLALGYVLVDLVRRLTTGAAIGAESCGTPPRAS